MTAGVRVFGYDNHTITGADGARSHVEQRINAREAAVIVEIFELSAAGHGVEAIAKRLNAARRAAPKTARSSSSWAPSSVRDALRRQRYRGVVVRFRPVLPHSSTHCGSGADRVGLAMFRVLANMLNIPVQFDQIDSMRVEILVWHDDRQLVSWPR